MAAKCGYAKANLLRKHLIAEKGVPTQSEVIEYLGSPLAEIYFNSLDEKGKQYLGLTPLLPPPPEPLWMSPSDVLLGKIALTPPLTDRHMRALRHEGILELGEKYMKQYEAQLELEFGKILKAKEEEIRNQVTAELSQNIDCIRRKEKEIYEKKIEDMKEKFEALVQIAIGCAVRYEKRKHLADLQRAREEVDELMCDIMEHKIMETRAYLLDHCKRDTLARLENQRREFYHFLSYIRHVTTTLLTELEVRHIESLLKLRCELEAENAADVCTVAAEERRKCDEKIGIIRKKHDKSLLKLNTELSNKDAVITNKNIAIMKLSIEVSAWQEKMELVLNEFQRFIDMAFNSAPGFASYMLDEEGVVQSVFSEIAEAQTNAESWAGGSCSMGFTKEELALAELRKELENKPVAEALHSMLNSALQKCGLKNTLRKSITESENQSISGVLSAIEEPKHKHRGTDTDDYFKIMLGDFYNQLVISFRKSDESDEKETVDESIDKFLEKRINDLLKIFRKYPSLSHSIVSSRVLKV